jgi:hypothetical protein
VRSRQGLATLSGRRWNVMQDQQIFPRAGCDGVGATLIVTELNEQSPVVKLLNNRADLPACNPLCRNVRQQRHYVQKGRPFVL